MKRAYVDRGGGGGSGGGGGDAKRHSQKSNKIEGVWGSRREVRERSSITHPAGSKGHVIGFSPHSFGNK